MNFKAFFLSSLFLFAIAGSAFANNADLTPSKDLAKKIQTELSRVDLDYTQLNGETLKIRFMINERQEIIVLSTDNKKLDNTIKDALNYDRLESKELKPFEVYVVPVTFESK
tara:strand:- start:57 stop:392 length:336 start_codon:yes stop_codon:yes gene_type:complete